jgi:glycosyltransferase involved in cell wall biosynthesis
LVGEGTQRTVLQSLAQTLGLGSCVHFVGWQNEASNFFRDSDIFVLPSRYEAMSMSLLEALAHSLPCVVTAVGENTNLIVDGVEGLVVPTENPQALAKALARLLSDFKLRHQMGQAAYAKAKLFNVDRMVEHTLAVYSSGLLK